MVSTPTGSPIVAVRGDIRGMGDPLGVDTLPHVNIPGVLRTPRLLRGDAFSVFLRLLSGDRFAVLLVVSLRINLIIFQMNFPIILSVATKRTNGLRSAFGLKIIKKLNQKIIFRAIFLVLGCKEWCGRHGMGGMTMRRETRGHLTGEFSRESDGGEALRHPVVCLCH